MKYSRLPLFILILLFIALLVSCSSNNIKDSEANDSFIENITKINYTGLENYCFSIIKCNLIKIEQVELDKSITGVDLSKIPYLKLTVNVLASTGQNILDGNIQIVMVKGQLSDNFLVVGNDYIFNIIKAPQWNGDINLIYKRVNVLLIDKSNKVLINDDGDTRPLSYESEIFKSTK